MSSWRRFIPKASGVIEAMEWQPDPKLRDSGKTDAHGVRYDPIGWTLETCDGRLRIQPGDYLVRVPAQKRPRKIAAYEFRRIWKEEEPTA